MRADRLFSIVLLLQSHRQLTARNLAHRLEVSERTIHRDMEALSGAGIPVVAERGTDAGDLVRAEREMKVALKGLPNDLHVQNDAGAMYLELARKARATVPLRKTR